MKKFSNIQGGCALIALKYVSKKSQEEVMSACAKYDFVEGAGMHDDEIVGAAKALGIRMSRLKKAEIPYNVELRGFIKNNPVGLFFLETWNHIFVLDNGIVYDPAQFDSENVTVGMRRKIIGVFEIIGVK